MLFLQAGSTSVQLCRPDMNCPKCQHEQNDENRECVRCGLIFNRYKPLDYDRILRKSPSKRFFNYIFHTKDKTEVVYFAGRLILLVFLLIWSAKFLLCSIESNYVGKSFMHLVNLPFHEAGHIVFMFTGSVTRSLGGSLGQTIMPLVCMLVLLIKTRDTFGASIALWWAGESILDTAPYINDARSLSLQLLGGNTGASAPYGFHDWNYILTELNLLRHDHLIAGITETSGKFVIVISLIWALVLLAGQFKRLNSN